MTRSAPTTRLRSALAVVTVLLLGIALAGCVPNRPGNAATWLANQAGIVSSEVLADHGGEFQSSGTSRGELAPNLPDDRFASLVKSVEDYLVTHDQVSIRLGRDGVDFVVSTDDTFTTTAIGLWRSLQDVPNMANALAWGDNSVHVRVLRPDAVAVLADLQPLGTDVSLEAFTDDAAVAADTKDDDFFNQSNYSAVSLGIHWPVGCTPPNAERHLAESFVGRAEIVGGDVELCSSFDLYFAEDASLATFAPELYSQLDDANLLTFPVSAHQLVDAAPDGHVVAITPGDPAALAVLGAFEVPGAPAVYYELDSDRSLGVTEYGTPTGDLLALVSASPVATSLPLIRIEGDTSAISGTLDQLPTMLTEVTALVATSDIFSNVELGPTTGTLYLNSPVATDPDVVTAAQLLRASGAWVGRSFTVGYGPGSLTIVDGVATVDDPNYTDPHVENAFIEAWNATVG